MTFEQYADAMVAHARAQEAEAREQTRLLRLLCRKLEIDPRPVGEIVAEQQSMEGATADAFARRRNRRKAG